MQRRMPAIITVFCGTNTFYFSYITQNELFQFTKICSYVDILLTGINAAQAHWTFPLHPCIQHWDEGSWDEKGDDTLPCAPT